MSLKKMGTNFPCIQWLVYLFVYYFFLVFIVRSILFQYLPRNFINMETYIHFLCIYFFLYSFIISVLSLQYKVTT